MAIPTGGIARLKTGCTNVHVAELLTDIPGIPVGTFSYDTPVLLDGATNTIDIADAVNSTQWYGDNQTISDSIAKGVIEVTLTKQSLSQDQEAFLLGKTIVNNYVIDKSNDIPPFVAVMYELTYDDGGSKFVQINKLRFQEPAVGATTITDTTELQALELVGNGIPRLADGVRKRTRIADVSTVDSIRTEFFGNANDATVIALTVAESPLDGATGEAITVIPTLTFNNEMQSTLANSSNVQLIDTVTGDTVATTISIDSTNKIVSITPGASLSAATKYIINLSDNLRDVFGQGISQSTDFTTA